MFLSRLPRVLGLVLFLLIPWFLYPDVWMGILEGSLYLHSRKMCSELYLESNGLFPNYKYLIIINGNKYFRVIITVSLTGNGVLLLLVVLVPGMELRVSHLPHSCRATELPLQP